MQSDRRTAEPIGKKLNPAVGYARRSTDMQERSIPDQQAHVEKWAAAHGYRVLRWLIDDAISGTSTKGRAAFERLLHEAENGRDFDAVLCYDIPRFSRGGTYETGYYLHRLKLAGVEVVFTAEGIPEGDEGELVAGVKSWQAKQYSVRLSRDCIRGTISHIVQKRCAPGGKPPFGYDKQHCTAAGQVLRTFRWLADGRKEEYGPDGKLIRVLAADETVKKAKSDIVRFVPSTADRVAIVRRIFEQTLAGYGARYIAARLNDEGIRSSEGGNWNANQVRRILANPTYRGAVVWNKRTMGKLHGVGRDGSLRVRGTRKGCHNNPNEDWFVVDDVHEPLVARAQFERARKMIEKRRGQGGLARPVNRSLLSGLIVCNHCGWNFRQNTIYCVSGGKRTPYRYYVDGGYNGGGRAVCICTHIPAAALDAWVTRKVRDLVLGDHATVAKAIDAFVRAVLGRQPKRRDAGDAERELESLNRRIKTTVGLLADPAFDGLDELRGTLAELKAKRDALNKRIAEAAAPAWQPAGEKELRSWAVEQFRDLSNACAGRIPILETRRVAHAYVDRIEIDPHAKRGILYLPADAYAIYTRGTLGEFRAGVKMKGEA